MSETDLKFIKLALAEAAKCVGEDDRSHPKVGAVVVKDGVVLGAAHRGELAPGDHAEFTALEKKLGADSLVGATIYTTLEPCTTRGHPKVPCAHRLVERKVRRVVIGMLDPNERICGRGLWHLRESGIETDLFAHEHMATAEELNREFIRLHRPKVSLVGDDSSLTAALAAPQKEAKEDDSEWAIISSLFDAAETRNFAAAEGALKELQARRGDAHEQERLQLVFWHLKVKHAQDVEAREHLAKAAAGTSHAAYATGLLASLEQAAGNIDVAIDMLGRAMDRAESPDEKAQHAIKAAEVHQSANERDAAAGVLRSASALDLSSTARGDVLRALSSLVSGDTAALQKAALLSKVASLDPNARSQFAAAYALGEAGLIAESAAHYELALKASPSDEGSLNNLGVAFEKLSLHGMGVEQYRKAADLGHTLSMANLAQRYINAGFFREADIEIKRGRLANDPHQNIGSAMVTLARSREEEKKRWDEERRVALGHKRILNEIASAIASPPHAEGIAGAWSVGTSSTVTLEIVGSAVEAAWEESSDKRRLRATIVGRAIFGTMEEWKELWKTYEARGTVCMVLRDDGTLGGLLLTAEGTIKVLQWTRPALPLLTPPSHASPPSSDVPP